MVSSAQPGRSSSGCYYIDKQPAAATRLRSSRWMPTPQQLMALKEMYQRGITTPTAQQIRLVTAQLRNFGRIEGKNVFYWFQNHRARERQKRRRQLMSSMYQSDSKQQQQQQQQQVTFTNNTVNGLEDKESAEGVTKSSLEVEQQSLEVEQQNKRKLPNIGTALSDQAASSVLQERMMSMVESNSSRQLVEQSDSLRPTSDTKASARLIDTNPLDFHYYYHYDYDAVLTAPIIYMREEERRETQTLELFPLKSENLKGAKDTKLPICRTTSKDTSADFMAENIISTFERIKAAYN